MRLLLLIAIGLLLHGCGVVREQQDTSTTTTVVTTEKVEEVIADTGEIVQLRTIERTTTESTTDSSSTGKSNLDLPEVKTAIRTLATTTLGPKAGEAASNIYELIIAGTGLAGAIGFGAKKTLDERQRRREALEAQRQRDELIDGVESAKRHMSPETWAQVRTTLNDTQSDDTIAAVRRRTDG